VVTVKEQNEPCVRPQQIASVALVLGVTVAGFLGARQLGERDARRESDHRAEVAAAQIRGRVEQGASLADGLRRYMVGVAGRGVASEEFASNSSRWLSPAGFPAAAWVEQVPASRRGAYERRIGRSIVTRDRRGRTVPVGPQSSYLPATLVSGIPPMAVSGIDFGGEPGVAAALARAGRLYDAEATPLTTLPDATDGLFLIRLAPRLAGGVVEPGFVVLFVSELWLRAAATDTDAATLQLTVGGRSTGDGEGVRAAFTMAGQRFDVLVPRRPVQGAAAVMPWIVLAGGLALAALAGALAVNAARRAAAQGELDRIFMLSPDVIAVADFDGRFRRLNPAAEQVLGYPREELLARPYLDFVHPDDRERTTAEAAAISRGRATLSFQNRYIRKDGSERVLEWTATPVVKDRTMYAVARDVTERRHAEAERARLVEEQAALRRVATLVARAVEPVEIFSAVSAEVERLFSLDVTTSDVATVVRFDPGPECVLVGATKRIEGLPVGSRWEPKELYVSTRVLRTGRSARIDEAELASVGGPDAEALRRQALLSQVASPIIVEGRLWGAMTVNARAALPPNAATRLEKFTELVGTAIANAESREALGELADEQAALRRVATLVAGGAPATEVFAAVAEEVARLLDARGTMIARLEPDETVVIVASSGSSGEELVGRRLTLEPSMAVTRAVQTGRPARVGDYEYGPGAGGELARRMVIRCAVAVPIMVEGSLWGSVAAGTERERFPPETEQRMTAFTELAATAIANAESRSALKASRARLVAASDETRRQIERDLHDGAQQRLVHTVITLKLARRALLNGAGNAPALVTEALDHAERATVELRELVHGILPPVLTRSGLRAAVQTLADRMPVPVEIGVAVDRLPPAVEATAYFVVAEALTNVAKHSNASHATVEARVEDGVLQVRVRDDGVGGAQPDGRGFLGLADRVAAFDGQLRVESPAGRGTLVAAHIPLRR
jgi:PAS domain S-box-containing protein